METYKRIGRAATVGLGLFFAFSCAKQREAKLAVGPESQVFAIQDLGSNDISKSIGTIHLSGDRAETLFADMALALNDRPGYLVSVEDSSVPAKMKYMLEGVVATGQPGQSFPITVAIDDSYLTVYKMVEKATDLSVLECGLSLKRPQLDILLGLQFGKAQPNSIQLFREIGDACEKSGEGMIYVPLFKYKIAAKGTLERKKNSLGEETAELIIKPTDIKLATHIQIASGVDARLNAPFMDVTNDEAIAHAYVADKVLIGENSGAIASAKVNSAPLATKVRGMLCNGNFETTENGKVISIPAKFVNVVLDINQNGKISETAKLVPTNKGSSRILSLDIGAGKEIQRSACLDSSVEPTVNHFKMIESAKPAEPSKPVETPKVQDGAKSADPVKTNEPPKVIPPPNATDSK